MLATTAQVNSGRAEVVAESLAALIENCTKWKMHSTERAIRKGGGSEEGKAGKGGSTKLANGVFLILLGCISGPTLTTLAVWQFMAGQSGVENSATATGQLSVAAWQRGKLAT